MKKNISFYQCPVCGNIVELIEGDMVHVICCGRRLLNKEAGI